MDCKKVAEANGLPEWGLDFEKSYSTIMDLAVSFALKGKESEMSEGWKSKFQQVKDDFIGKPTVLVGSNANEKQSNAERIARKAGDNLQAAFIHDVRRKRMNYFVNGHGTINGNIHFFDTYYDAAHKAFELGLISRAGMRRVERAFRRSSIVKMCQNPEIFADGRYPCIDKERGTLIDIKTFEPFEAGPGTELGMDIHDGTVVFPECLVAKSNGRIVYPTTPKIVPPKDGSRCASISRVMKAMSVVAYES